jgi:hypothetical protein
MLDSGRDHRPGGDGPLCKAAPLQAVRSVHLKRFPHDGEGSRDEAERKAWRRNWKQAIADKLIATETVNGAQLVWLVKSA